MRTHEWGPVGDVGLLTPGTLFYAFLEGATHIAMKVEVADDHGEHSYYCAVLSPEWGGNTTALPMARASSCIRITFRSAFAPNQAAFRGATSCSIFFFTVRLATSRS
jgi:hypothetical protein